MTAISWRIAMASVTGTSHLGIASPCQDVGICEMLETKFDHVLVAVVSDGAGTAIHSDVGAWLAAKTFLEAIDAFFQSGGQLDKINDEVAGAWLHKTISTLAMYAEDAGHLFRDYACTLLAAIVGEKSAAFIQIGDGAIVVSDGQNNWSWVFWPQHGEFANTTNFLTSPDAREVFEFRAMQTQIDEVALFSDGLENLVLHHSTKSVHSAFFDEMFKPVRRGNLGIDKGLSESLEKYLSSQIVCEKTDDDKTLVMASRRKEPSAEVAANEPPSET